MRMNTQIIAGLLLLITANLALAANPCDTQNNTIEINACAKKQFDDSDKLLNTTYQALLKNIPDTNDPGVEGETPKVLLIKSQRIWINFREADCRAKFQLNAGGTIRTVVYLGCMQERTAQRIKELNKTEWVDG